MTEITNEFLKNLTENEKRLFISRHLKIGMIHAFREKNFKTKEIRIKSFLIWTQIENTGYLSPSAVYTINYNLSNKKLFNLLLKKLDENSDSFYSQDYYPATPNPYLATLYIPKDLSIKIKNKIKFGYKVLQVKYPDEENSKFREFFEITLKNFSNHTLMIPVDQSLEFFNYFDNREIKASFLTFEKEALKIIDKFERVQRGINKELEANLRRLHGYQTNIDTLKNISENKENVENRIYDVFTKEEIASQKLLKLVKEKF